MAKNKSKSLSTPSLKGAGTSSTKELKKALKRGGGGQYLKRIPADGYNVRFLTEPTAWFKYLEHYDKDKDDDRYFACVENDCPGCAQSDKDKSKVSKRWLVNALDIEEGKVVPLVLPSTLVSNLMKKYDKFGTMTDRDYELVKDGQGLDTEYDCIYDGPKKMKIDRYDLIDLEAALLTRLSAAADDDDDDADDDDDDDDLPKRTKDKGKKSTKDSKSTKAKDKGKEKPTSKPKDKPKGKSAPPSKGKDKKGLSKSKSGKKSLSKK